MNPISIDVKDKLVASGIGVFKATSGWSIHISNEPTSPDTTITIYDTPSDPPAGYLSRAKKPYRSNAFQIRVRALTYEAAFSKIITIQNTFLGYGVFSVGTTDYHIFAAEGDIVFLKQDEQQRYIWVANFVGKRQEQNA